MRGLIARVRRRIKHGAEAGFTLLELLVGMGIMTVFMGMFTGAVFELYHSANQSQALAQADDQLNQAFQRLDTIARYAGYVAVPGHTGVSGDNDWYVEFATLPQPIQSSTAPQTVTCYQLRIHTPSTDSQGELQMRSWGPSGVSAWKQIASNIVNGAAPAGQSTQPFWYVAPTRNGLAKAGELTLHLTASAGGSQGESTSTQVTFTTINTYAGTPLSGFCPRSGP